jgi:hypothetical protein
MNKQKFLPIKPAEVKSIRRKKSSPYETLEHPDFAGYIWKYYKDDWESKSIPGATPDDCYIWKGANHRQGYGFYNVRKENDPEHSKSGQMNAQRFALALKLGRPIVKGEFTLATCHNPQCTNPEHLTLCTTRNEYMLHSEVKCGYRKKYDTPFYRCYIRSITCSKVMKEFDLPIAKAGYLKLITRKKTELDKDYTGPVYSPQVSGYEIIDLAALRAAKLQAKQAKD